MAEMNDIQEMIAELRSNGWTLAAVADEVAVSRNTVDRWYRGERYPTNAAGVRVMLRRLSARRRIPKRRRYGPDAPQRQPRKGPTD